MIITKIVVYINILKSTQHINSPKWVGKETILSFLGPEEYIKKHFTHFS